MINNMHSKRLEKLILKKSEELNEAEYKLATQLLLLLAYEEGQSLNIYIDEIANGIDFFTETNKRILFSTGLNVEKQRIPKLMKSLERKKVLNFKNEAYGLLKVW